MVQPRRVVDIGCGVGLFLQVFSGKGVKYLCGVDGDWVPREDLRIPLDQFIPHDLRRPVVLNEHFDLAVCLEVAEHLPEEAAPALIDSLTGLAPIVLFSAAVPRQGGVGHLNEQWPEYWAALFEKRGFVAVDCIRRRIWENERVLWWYAQNILLFVKKDHFEKEPALQYELTRTQGNPLAVVHPRAFLHHQEHARARRHEETSFRSVLSHCKRWVGQRCRRLTNRRPTPRVQ